MTDEQMLVSSLTTYRVATLGTTTPLG